jgi:thiosulfate/3-mercaptopyruvate sulfurtransferase
MTEQLGGTVPADPDPSPLIDVDELLTLLSSDEPVALLDVRWRLGGPPGREEYERWHLPSAVYVDLDTDLAGPPGGDEGRHPLPSPAALQSSLRRAGLRDGQLAVVYDDAGGTSAARGWWLLRWAGIRCRLLDGGLGAWTGADQPLEAGSPQPVEGDVVVRPGGMPTVTADDVLGLATNGVLLDARAGERYRGEVEPVDPVAGHIPGARNAPTTENLGPDGRFLAASTLARRFADVGIHEGVAVGAYCGSGVTAAHTVLALALVGVEAALYPGSWSGWIADPSRPVA